MSTYRIDWSSSQSVTHIFHAFVISSRYWVVLTSCSSNRYLSNDVKNVKYLIAILQNLKIFKKSSVFLRLHYLIIGKKVKRYCDKEDSDDIIKGVFWRQMFDWSPFKTIKYFISKNQMITKISIPTFKPPRTISKGKRIIRNWT